MWITAEQFMISDLSVAPGQRRSFFEQYFRTTKQQLMRKNRPPRGFPMDAPDKKTDVWISVDSARLRKALMQSDSSHPIEAPAAPVLSVSELLRSVRDVLERRFPLAWISGEV